MIIKMVISIAIKPGILGKKISEKILLHYFKKCLIIQAFDGIKNNILIKTTLRFHLTLVRMAIFKGKNNKFCKDEIKQELLYTVGGNAN
jgi:hypothetical protein